jgi:hypothetical protein
MLQSPVTGLDNGISFEFNMPPVGMVDAAALAVATVARITPMPNRSFTSYQVPYLPYERLMMVCTTEGGWWSCRSLGYSLGSPRAGLGDTRT